MQQIETCADDMDEGIYRHAQGLLTSMKGTLCLAYILQIIQTPCGHKASADSFRFLCRKYGEAWAAFAVTDMYRRQRVWKDRMWASVGLALLL